MRFTAKLAIAAALSLFTVASALAQGIPYSWPSTSSGGGGGTSGTVSGVSPQVGYFTGNNAIGGDAGLTYATSTGLAVSVATTNGAPLTLGQPSMASGYGLLRMNAGRQWCWLQNGNGTGSSLELRALATNGACNSGIVTGVRLILSTNLSVAETLTVTSNTSVGGGLVVGGPLVSASTAALDVYGDISNTGAIRFGPAGVLTNNGSNQVILDTQGGTGVIIRNGANERAMFSGTSTPLRVRGSTLLGFPYTVSSPPDASNTLHVWGGITAMSPTVIGSLVTPTGTMLDVYGDISNTGVINVNGARMLVSATGTSLYWGTAGTGNTGGTSGVGRNVGIGAGTLFALTTGSGNVGVGHQTLANVTSVANNAAVGYLACRTVSGANNTCFGGLAGQSLTTGTGNLLLGYNVAAFSDTGSNQLNLGNAIYGDLARQMIGIGITSPTANFAVSGTTMLVSGVLVGANTQASASAAIMDVYGTVSATQGDFTGGVANQTLRYGTTGNRISFSGSGGGWLSTNSGFTYTAAGTDRSAMTLNLSTAPSGANLAISGTLYLTGGATGRVACTSALDGAYSDSSTYKTLLRCDGPNAQWKAIASTTIVVPATTP